MKSDSVNGAGAVLTIRRVANGWIIQPARADNGESPANVLAMSTHIAATPDDLAKHVALWATAQLATTVPWHET